MSFTFDNRSSDSPLVNFMWQTQSDHAGSFISAAAVHFGMVVSHYEGKTMLTIRGPETKASPAEFPAGCEFFGINFKLGTYMPHLPAKVVMDRQDLNLPEASSQSFWFHGSAWQFPTFENADTFVNRLIHEGMLAYEPVVDAVLQGQEPDLSPRAVQYRFLHATGLTQNTVRQIERAKRATALLVGGVAIQDTIFETGYYDQAHLTRSLKRFTGQTPAQIAAEKESLIITP